MTDEFVSRMLEVNVRAQYSASREASKYLREGGSIVNIASIAALRGGANISAYSTSKAAVIDYTVLCSGTWTQRALGLMRLLTELLIPPEFKIN